MNNQYHEVALAFLQINITDWQQMLDYAVDVDAIQRLFNMGEGADPQAVAKNKVLLGHFKARLDFAVEQAALLNVHQQEDNQQQPNLQFFESICNTYRTSS